MKTEGRANRTCSSLCWNHTWSISSTNFIRTMWRPPDSSSAWRNPPNWSFRWEVFFYFELKKTDHRRTVVLYLPTVEGRILLHPHHGTVQVITRFSTNGETTSSTPLIWVSSRYRSIIYLINWKTWTPNVYLDSSYGSLTTSPTLTSSGHGTAGEPPLCLTLNGSGTTWFSPTSTRTPFRHNLWGECWTDASVFLITIVSKNLYRRPSTPCSLLLPIPSSNSIPVRLDPFRQEWLKSTDESAGHTEYKELVEKIRNKEGWDDISDYMKGEDFQKIEPEGGLEILCHAILKVGSKSYAHLMGVMDRCVPILQGKIQGYAQQIVLLDAIHDVWMNSPIQMNIIIEKLMVQDIVQPLSIANYVFAKTEWFDQPFLWDVLTLGINKSINRIHSLKSSCQDKGEHLVIVSIWNKQRATEIGREKRHWRGQRETRRRCSSSSSIDSTSSSPIM